MLISVHRQWISREEGRLQVEVTPIQRLGNWGAEWPWGGCEALAVIMPYNLESALNDFPLHRDRKYNTRSLVNAVGRPPGKDTKHGARVQGHAESNRALEPRGNQQS